MTECQVRGPGFDSWLGCGGHFFRSPVAVLFLLSLSKYLFCTHPKCSLKKKKKNIYIYRREEGSQKNMNGKTPEGQMYAPRLEPTAPIHLADRNHVHCPSCHIVQLTPWIRCLNQYWLPFGEQKGVFPLASWIWCFKCA